VDEPLLIPFNCWQQQSIPITQSSLTHTHTHTHIHTNPEWIAQIFVIRKKTPKNKRGKKEKERKGYLLSFFSFKRTSPYQNSFIKLNVESTTEEVLWPFTPASEWEGSCAGLLQIRLRGNASIFFSAIGILRDFLFHSYIKKFYHRTREIKRDSTLNL
jgi:hypothetical protein